MEDALKKAMALRTDGKLDEAAIAFREILKNDPHNYDALRLAGLIDVSLGDADGIQLIEKAIRQHPERAHAYLDVGSALHRLKRWPEALQSYNDFIKKQPNHAHAYFLCGAVYLELKKSEDARRALLRCIQLNPEHSEAYFALSKLCMLERKFDAARHRLKTFIRLQPGDVRGVTQLASCLNEMNRSAEALEVLQTGTAAFPTDKAVWNLLAQNSARLEQLEEAVAAYKESLRLDPEQAHCHSNLGGILERIPGREKEAEVHHRKAIELEPELWNAWSNFANFLRTVHRLDEAEAVLRQTLERDPDNFELHTTLGLVLLSNGKLGEGFQKYGYRWKKDFKRLSLREIGLQSRPFWDGSPIEGKTLFVWPEQGNGDYLQFLRYVPMLADSGVQVILGAKKGLEGLARTVPGVGAVVLFEGPVDPKLRFDYHCPIVNLPECFKTDMDSIPASTPYVFPRQERISAWKQALTAIRKPRIGLVWAGRPAHIFDAQRSLALELLDPVLGYRGVQYYSLQVGANSPDVQQLPHGQVIDLSSKLTDYEETAAAIENLDLVVSVDTSVAHLAGALGKPVWMLLSSAPSLMWLRDRDDSPWYSSMRIFRQADDEGWEPVIERLKEALEERFG